MLGKLQSVCSLEERTMPIFVQSFIEDFAGGTSNPWWYVCIASDYAAVMERETKKINRRTDR
jgi:hypothetical protein